MNCPACKDENLVMSDRQGVEIDYCPKCRGVWLDRGELDKIIDRSAPEQPSAPQYSKDQYKHSDKYGHHKKRKSILGEIFDF